MNDEADFLEDQPADEVDVVARISGRRNGELSPAFLVHASESVHDQRGKADTLMREESLVLGVLGFGNLVEKTLEITSGKIHICTGHWRWMVMSKACLRPFQD
jgi:hypothetical protein